MDQKRMLISHGGSMAFGDDQTPVAVSDFDFDGVDARLEAESTEAQELLRLDDFNHERARRAAARHLKKNACGRRGLPRDVVRQMHKDYLRLGSLSQVARIYKRTRQSMWETFRTANLPMNARRMNAMVRFGGMTFTPGKHGTYRESGVRRRPRYLHHVIWEAKHKKPVPPGWQVTFANGDNSDFRPGNIVALPGVEVRRLHWARRHPDRAHLSKHELREFWKQYYRDYAARRSAEFVKRGLRADGKPRSKRH